MMSKANSIQRLVSHRGPIKSVATYRKKMAEFKKLAEELEMFEKEKWPQGKPPLTELIEARLHDLGLASKDLVGVVGTKGHVSELLAGNRAIPRGKLLDVADLLEVDVKAILKAEQEMANEKGQGAHVTNL